MTKLDQGKTFVHIYIKNGTAVPVNSGFKISLKSEDCNKVEDVPGTPIPWPKIGANQEINMAGEKGWEITCDYANP